KYRSRSDFIAKNMSTFEWLDVFHDLFRRSLGVIVDRKRASSNNTSRIEIAIHFINRYEDPGV
ncbi:MAG: hypothetical protein ABW087_16000, partial [Candidatus Thiodiazotropha sp.]